MGAGCLRHSTVPDRGSVYLELSLQRLWGQSLPQLSATLRRTAAHPIEAGVSAAVWWAGGPAQDRGQGGAARECSSVNAGAAGTQFTVWFQFVTIFKRVCYSVRVSSSARGPDLSLSAHWVTTRQPGGLEGLVLTGEGAAGRTSKGVRSQARKQRPGKPAFVS